MLTAVISLSVIVAILIAFIVWIWKSLRGNWKY